MEQRFEHEASQTQSKDATNWTAMFGMFRSAIFYLTFPSDAATCDAGPLLLCIQIHPEALCRSHIYMHTLITRHSGSDVANQSDLKTGIGSDVDGQ